MTALAPLAAPPAIAGDVPRASRRSVLTNRHVLVAGALLLLGPDLLFALQLKPLPAALMLAGVAGALALQPGRTAAAGPILSAPLDMARLALCSALALTLLLLGGEAHLVFANWDWLWRDSVLADLAHAPFPPTYRVDGATMVLRAPLGMYMLPALVAKLGGLGAGHVALLAQNAALLGLVLYLLATLSGRRAALVLAIFLSFSGLDVVGQLLQWVRAGHPLAGFALPSHIENWASFFQYSSTITQLFWVPNHALPSYWLALLAVLCARREASVGDLGLAMAASLFWSPFAVLGALPFAGYLFVREARGTVASLRFWAAAAVSLCFLPVAFYMQADAAQVPHGFILFMPTMAATIGLFLLIEVPHVLIVREVWADLAPWLKGLLAVAIGVLIVLPTMRLGVSNDLVMRASIPALTILSIGFAEALAVGWPHRPGLLAAGLCLGLVGAITPAQEVARALTFAPYGVSGCNLVTVWHKLIPQLPTLDNYLARASRLPDGLLGVPAAAPLVDQPGQTCWRDIPYDPRSSIGTQSNTMIRRDAAKGPHAL